MLVLSVFIIMTILKHTQKKYVINRAHCHTFSPFDTLVAPPAPDTEAKYLDHQSNLFASCFSDQNHQSIIS